MVYSLRNKVLIFFFCVISVWSCKEDKSSKIATEPNKKPELIMYQPSEMAGLMNAMYAYNLQLKAQIINGETPTALPLDLMKLHTAEMSNGHQRTAKWNSFVNLFIETQQSVLDTLSNTALKTRYNAAINNCLACHKTECTGPIPKIKKLLIQ